MMSKIVEILKENNIKLDEGLSDLELEQFETIYSVTIPPELKELYSIALSVSKGFYNWRAALDKRNIQKFKNILDLPFEGVKQDIEEIDWVEKWGDEPKDKEIKNKIINEKLTLAPKLIPVFDHRYI